VSGRYAPSPTGALHIGNLRTALLAWLFARTTDRRFLMRIEDLDDTADKRIGLGQLADLEAIGLDWDDPVLHQSDRVDRYRHHLTVLRDAGLTYPCWCSRREVREAASAPHGDPMPDGAYPGTCRDLSPAERGDRAAATEQPPALRLRSQVASIEFVDNLHGTVRAGVDDFVLQRRDGVPSYNLAVVVDDAETGVDQVVRGDDLLLSTPRQLHLADLLGLPRPTHAHVPLAVNAEGERLAKRDGAITLADLGRLGLAPAAVVALLARSLGLAGEREQPTAPDLIERFDAEGLPRTPWVFVGPDEIGSHP